MIKKISISLVALAALAFGYWTISPFFTNRIVKEELQTSNTIKILEGSFTGFDKIHNGTGTVSVYSLNGKKTLRFEDGFSVNNGPDLYVGFGKNGQYVKGSEISELKGNIGSQNYELPENFIIDQYDSVYVWCKAFSTPFIKADLKPLN